MARLLLEHGTCVFGRWVPGINRPQLFFNPNHVVKITLSRTHSQERAFKDGIIFAVLGGPGGKEHENQYRPTDLCPDQTGAW
jgi:hypothetical protein